MRLTQLPQRLLRRWTQPADAAQSVPSASSGGFQEQHQAYVRAGANTHFLDSASFFALPGSAERVRVWAGDDNLLGCSFVFESDAGEIHIGSRCFINSNTQLIARSRITIGSDVMISWSCWLYDHGSHSLRWRQRQVDMRRQLENFVQGRDLRAAKEWSPVPSAPITIQDKVWLGFDVVVFQGVTIGEGAVVGARSIVTHDVEPWTVVAGSPARFIRAIPPEDR
jgi:galactoside O-acetyltransferase